MTPSRRRSTRRWRFCAWRSRISSAAAWPRIATTALKIRVGTLAIPLDTLEVVDLTPATFETHKLQILAVEQERYGAAAKYPPDVLRAGRRPLLQFPLETLETTASNPRAIGIALRDRVSARLVGYALGSALENHDEEGVGSDPHFGENNTFYLQAMATLADRAERRRARELPAGLVANARDRGRVRVPLDADRGTAARHGSAVVPRRSRSGAGSRTTCTAAPRSPTCRSR